MSARAHVQELTRFQEEVIPAQKVAHHQLPEGADRWKTVIPIIEELKVKAKKLGLWNLFLSKTHYPKHGVPLTNLEVRNLAERVGLVSSGDGWYLVCCYGRGPWTRRSYGFAGGELLSA